MNAGRSQRTQPLWLMSVFSDLKRAITHYGFEGRQLYAVREALNTAESSSNCLFFMLRAILQDYLDYMIY